MLPKPEIFVPGSEFAQGSLQDLLTQQLQAVRTPSSLGPNRPEFISVAAHNL